MGEFNIKWNLPADTSKLQDFFHNLEEVINEYSNFEVKLDYTSEMEDVRFDINTDLDIPNSILRDFSIEPLKRILTFIGKSIENKDKVQGDILQTITQDVSLSYIFSKYLELDKQEQYKYIKVVDDLKRIGAKTYENQPVNIGVIYCEEKSYLNEIELLDVDIIFLPTKKPIQLFFLEEKPLLKLVDNQSLVTVVDENFEVFALIRKRANGKSLSYILESQFNDWAIDTINKNILDYIVEIVTQHLNEEEVKALNLEKILNVFKKMESKEPPKYTYFSIREKEVSIFTNQKFVISYINGDWQLKHYNLMLSIIMKSILFHAIVQIITFDHQKTEKFMEDLKLGVLKLYETIKRISQHNTSSIFLILFHNDFFDRLTSTDVKRILMKNGFKQNNLDREFINVIRDDKNHLNVREADSYLIEDLAAIDGAVLLDRYLNILSFGEVINIPSSIEYKDTFGTGTKAARYASKLGIAIKISEDGDICIFDKDNLVLKI